MVTELTKTVIGKFWASGGNCLSQMKLFRPRSPFSLQMFSQIRFLASGDIRHIRQSILEGGKGLRWVSIFLFFLPPWQFAMFAFVSNPLLFEIDPNPSYHSSHPVLPRPKRMCMSLDKEFHRRILTFPPQVVHGITTPVFTTSRESS